MHRLRVSLVLSCLILLDFFVAFILSNIGIAASSQGKQKVLSASISKLPTPAPTLTPTPALLSTSTSIPIPTALPTPTPTQSQTLSSELLKQVNDFRASNGLPSVQTNGYTCGFASIRAQEISQNFNHDGFNQRLGSRTLPYPSYSLVVENIEENSDSSQVITDWIASPGHNANMRADTTYACIANSGDYYTYEGYKP